MEVQKTGVLHDNGSLEDFNRATSVTVGKWNALLPPSLERNFAISFGSSYPSVNGCVCAGCLLPFPRIQCMVVLPGSSAALCHRLLRCVHMGVCYHKSKRRERQNLTSGESSRLLWHSFVASRCQRASFSYIQWSQKEEGTPAFVSTKFRGQFCNAPGCLGLLVCWETAWIISLKYIQRNSP